MILENYVLALLETVPKNTRDCSSDGVENTRCPMRLFVGFSDLKRLIAVLDNLLGRKFIVVQKSRQP